MPIVLTDQNLKEVKYVSMTDYIQKMDELDDFADKMAFTTRYLLAYGVDQQRDVSLAEAIHIAKLKIADASAKVRAQMVMVPDEAVDPNASEEADGPARSFMIEPVAFLQNEANRLLLQEASDNPSEVDQRRIEGYQLMAAVLANDTDGNLAREVSEREIQPTSRDVEARLKAKFGGAKELEKTVKATKPGFLSRLFATPSRAYNNLEQVYEAFQNPNHALYGDMNSLDKAATEYLKHCFPRWNPKAGSISKSVIARLKDPQKSRAMLSLNILKSTAEQRQGEPVLETIVQGNRQKVAEEEAQAGDEVLENAEFQEGIRNEIAKEEELSEQAEADYHKNFEDVPEVEDESLDLEN